MLKRGFFVLCGLVSSIVLAVPVSASGTTKTQTAYEDLGVVLLAPVEARAVVQGRDGELHLLKPGDLLPGTEAQILQILPDRLVVEEAVPGTTNQRRKLWIHRERTADGKTRVQVLDREQPPLPPVYQPSLQPDLPSSPASGQPALAVEKDDHGR